MRYITMAWRKDNLSLDRSSANEFWVPGTCFATTLKPNLVSKNDRHRNRCIRSWSQLVRLFNTATTASLTTHHLPFTVLSLYARLLGPGAALNTYMPDYWPLVQHLIHTTNTIHVIILTLHIGLCVFTLGTTGLTVTQNHSPPPPTFLPVLA